MRIAFLMVCGAMLFLTACATKKYETDDFDKRSLEIARLILDKGATNLNTELKWSEVDNLFGTDVFTLHPEVVSSPVEWAFLEVRIRGDGNDKTRCFPYFASTNLMIYKEAVKTFAFLSKPAEKGLFADVLESNDRLICNLVLAYSGLDSARPSNEELQALMTNSDKRVQYLARSVFEKKVGN
jgi:hypothetical protein